MATPLTDRQVVVIGGGVFGLAAASFLWNKGIRVRVLEQSHRAGGLIHSERTSGWLLEHAATCLFNFLPEVDLFCQNLGLAPAQVFRQESAKRRYLVRNGQPTPVPMDAAGWARSRLISPGGKLRVLLEPLIPRGVAGSSQETVAQFVTRRFGREFYDRTIEPYVSGTLAGDGEQACLRSTFSQLAALEEEHGSVLKGILARKLRGVRASSCNARVFSFREGMAAIPQAIAARLGDDFLPERTVLGLERRGARWLVTAGHAPSGATEVWEADAVVVATPAPVAAGLLRPLSRELAGLLGGIRYAPILVTHLAFDRLRVNHPLDGIGCLVPRCEKGFSLLGSLWPSTLFAGRAPEGQALFMNYQGGSRHPGMADWSDQALLERSLADLGCLVGHQGAPLLARVTRHPRALPQYYLGHQALLGEVDKGLTRLPGLFLAGNYLHGVSVRVGITQGAKIADQVVGQLA